MLKFIDYIGYIRVGGNYYIFFCCFIMCFNDFFSLVVSYCYGRIGNGCFCMGIINVGSNFVGE